VEAIGYPFMVGVQRCLRSGLFRPDKSPVRPSKETTAADTLFLAERIRNLTREEAARHPKASIKGIVTWAHPRSPFAFVQDASGNVRVLNPQWDRLDTSKAGTIVTLSGEVVEGDFVPAITNATIIRSGWWNLNEGTFITLEQAMTGTEEGSWVEMRGYVRAITYTNGLARLNLGTSTGEFDVWTPGTPDVAYMEGSIIRVGGVCAATANPNHQLTGIQIWAPEIKYFKTEEPKPYDLFAVEMRPLASLSRFNMERALNRRLRTYGTVILHEPGRYVYVQDGHDGVMALSQQKDILKPGDRVELVGFPGNEGRQFLLREAVYRRVARGDQPAPFTLKDLQNVDMDLAGRLASGKGTVLNTVISEGEATLHLHANNTAFEARMTGLPGTFSALAAIEPGSEISATGVYEIQMDEYGRPRSFQLHMRSPDDVQVIRAPPWWTFTRLLWLFLGLLAASTIGLVWTILISRKNSQLCQAQADLEQANDQLEQRVEVRTRELREQVSARERAHAELAQTQQRLILASRQAGMAEIATGVLHNVGNVLNSVNVSIGLLSERMRQFRVEFVGKTAALLQQNRNNIGTFLTEDPKGRTLPTYLEQLGQSLERDKRFIHHELELLNKNVDHIKIIVAMQQSHAKSGGVIEEVDPRDLIEDALKVNSAALERHHIVVERQYDSVPAIAVDRHKVLQILINLISNAKWALDTIANGKKVTIELAEPESDRIRIRVTDNGAGIAPENMGRIFSQGFTTRKDGHGFGLHSGANAARELGGSLSVHSEGAGKGATFTLELPKLK
jgi:signal transduction histidine kinase